MRIKSLHLENFKAFGQRAIVPMAPITLIFGENSAGKSTILQALHLLKQTHESRDPSAILSPSLDQGIVDLGSVPELLFDHDAGRTLKIRIVFDFDSDPLGSTMRLLRRISGESPDPPSWEAGGLELHFEYSAESQSVSVCEVQVVNSDAEPIARFERPGSSSDGLISFWWKVYDHPRFHPAFRPEHDAKRYSGPTSHCLLQCTVVTKSREFWKESFEFATNNRSQIVSDLKSVLHQLRDRGLDADDKWEEMFDGRLAYLGVQGLGAAIDFYESDFTLGDFISRMGRQQVGHIIGVEGFTRIDYTGVDELWGHFPETGLPKQTDGDGAIEDVRSLACYYGSHLRTLLGRILAIGSYRDPPSRWFNYAGSIPPDVGYKGEGVSDILFGNPELVARANDWLQRLDTGYELHVATASTRYSHLYEVRLRDLRRKKPVDVSLKDVGFGISQILPVIVQCVTQYGRIISIEQPEVHVHPRLQANLGDLLAESIQEPRSNQFIIETHSEHLA